MKIEIGEGESVKILGGSGWGLWREVFHLSEWYEVPQNNDRPHFMKWLGMRNVEEV